MGKIRFIEQRRLLDNSIVNVGDIRDFGDEENAAFVANQVAGWADPAAAAAEPPVGGEEVLHG